MTNTNGIDETTQTSNPAPRHRGWLTFSLRDLLFVVVIVGCLAALWIERQEKRTLPSSPQFQRIAGDGLQVQYTSRPTPTSRSRHNWMDCRSIEIHGNMIVIDQGENYGRIVPTSNLSDFRWRRLQASPSTRTHAVTDAKEAVKDTY